MPTKDILNSRANSRISRNRRYVASYVNGWHLFIPMSLRYEYIISQVGLCEFEGHYFCRDIEFSFSRSFVMDRSFQMGCRHHFQLGYHSQQNR
jgi:hypothetical protein